MFNIIKCYKVKKTHITKVSNHTHRQKLTEEEQSRIKLDLSSQNRVLVGSNVSADIRNRIKNHSTNKTRKDAVYAEHYIISASPDFFAKYPEKTEEWIKEQVIFLKNEFGSNLTTAVLHLDETTPHVEAFVTPIIKNSKTDKFELNRKAFNAARGGLNSFRKLQDRHYEHNAKFDLKRGISNDLTGVTAKTLKQYYQETKDYIENDKNLKNSIDAEKLVPEKRGFLKKYSREEVLFIVKRTKRIKENILKSAMIYKHKFRDLYVKYQNLYRKLLKKYKELEDENKRIIAENEVMIKSYNKLAKIANETALIAELGRKAIDLDMTEEIEEKYELKHTPEPEPEPEQKKQNKLKNSFF